MIRKLIEYFTHHPMRLRRVLNQAQDLFRRKKNQLPLDTALHFTEVIKSLDSALKAKDFKKASGIAQSLKQLSTQHLKKSMYDYFNEWVLGLGLTLLVVAIINQAAFQLMEVPSGSMRPTLMEKDRLIANKTSFGINLPFKSSHLYFNPDLVKRGDLVIFTTNNMPKEENKSRYLFVFPVKKQMVKRVVAKPGDTIYFYGGKVYGLDSNGNEITAYRQEPFTKLEHIPFMTLEGKVITSKAIGPQNIQGEAYLYQMNQAVAKLNINGNGHIQGKFSNGMRWVDESEKFGLKDLWGIKNYAMTRIITNQQAQELGYNTSQTNSGYYLELHHSPHTKHPKPHLGMDMQGRVRPMLTAEKTIIALSNTHLERIKNALNTSRFVVKDGYINNYSMNSKFQKHAYTPHIHGLKDGTYEVIEGKAYRISHSGKSTLLDSSHPLNANDHNLTQLLFNCGVHFNLLFNPTSSYQDFMPMRYSYFKEGQLCLFNRPIFDENDPTLKQFISTEQTKLRPFVDHNPVLKDGKIDKTFIKNYGLKIPPRKYLGLGDNPSLSRDCRDFGLIDEESIEGSPLFIFWPNSERLGPINFFGPQKVNGPTYIVYGVGLAIIALLSLRSKRIRTNYRLETNS